MGREPGEEHGVGNAGLTPDMHHRQLAGAQEPSKGVRAHIQPPLGFFEGDQLWRDRKLQGKFLLPCGRASAEAEASGRGSHGRGLTSQERDVRRGGWTRTAERTGFGRHRCDGTDEIC
jgi:hypothetical protein